MAFCIMVVISATASSTMRSLLVAGATQSCWLRGIELFCIRHNTVNDHQYSEFLKAAVVLHSCTEDAWTNGRLLFCCGNSSCSN